MRKMFLELILFIYQEQFKSYLSVLARDVRTYLVALRAVDARFPPLCFSLPTCFRQISPEKHKHKNGNNEGEGERERNELMLLWGLANLISVGQTNRLETQQHFYFILLRQNSFLSEKPQCFTIKAFN